MKTLYHHSYTKKLLSKLKPEKNSGLNEIQTCDLYDTSAVLYQLSYLHLELLQVYYKLTKWPAPQLERWSQAEVELIYLLF